jgi:hypothetical protein
MKFDVLNRWTGSVQFTAEIECAEDEVRSVKLGLAVKWAFANGASLDGARLDGARLDGASLVGARLDGARLDGASLDGASLDGARLDGASLVGARLDGARLDGARLDGASLVGARLDGARLDGASLVGARLDGARLDGASLVGARLDERALRPIRADFFDILLRARNEVPALLVALREGRIDGSTYTGACACLCGTIANVRHVNVETLDFRDSDRPAEVWFMAINQGDTPETNTVAKITEGWIEEFLAITSPAQEPAAA